MKQKVRLTENDLHIIIKQCINEVQSMNNFDQKAREEEILKEHPHSQTYCDLTWNLRIIICEAIEKVQKVLKNTNKEDRRLLQSWVEKEYGKGINLEEKLEQFYEFIDRVADEANDTENFWW